MKRLVCGVVALLMFSGLLLSPVARGVGIAFGGRTAEGSHARTLARPVGLCGWTDGASNA